MNTIILSGRLTAAPELRTTTNGIDVASATIAVDDGYGENKTTDFIRLIFWRKLAETVTKYANKGYKIIIEGKLKMHRFEDKNGNKRTDYEVHVEKLELPPKKESEQMAKENMPDITLDDDDLPF